VGLTGAGRDQRRKEPAISIDDIPYKEYIPSVAWQVEYTDEFGAWWDTLGEDKRIRLTASVGLLERHGPNLPFPHSSGTSGSRHGRMRELRVQVGGRPLRVFYAFDPRRVAILLIVGLQPTDLIRGGDKTGQDDFYTRMIPLADQLYDEHLAEIAADRTTGEENDGG
jgi:hypothetical protein